MIELKTLTGNVSSLVQLEPCYILQPMGYYLFLIWIIGTAANGFIIYVFSRYKTARQSSTNILIFGLVLADFAGSFFIIPLPTLALVTCRRVFSMTGCIIEAIAAYFTGCSNIYLLCLISIDRYFVVTRSFAVTIITAKQAYLSVLCAYLLALFWSILPLFGWSAYDYEGTGASCSIKWEDRSLNVTSYNMTIFFCVYIIPVAIIILTNIKSYKAIHERRRRTSMNMNEAHIQRQILIERRITHTVIFIIGGFLVAWTPYAIIVFIRIFIDGTNFPPILGTLPALFAKTSVVWNPLIYVVRNGNIRIYLPCCTPPIQHDRTSDPTRLSSHPLSSVQLPLASTPSSRQN